MRSELAENLKTVLDNMSQEQFDKEWEKIENQGFPNVILLTGNEIIDELSNYVSQMINSNAEYNKKPLKKILKKIESYENKKLQSRFSSEQFKRVR